MGVWLLICDESSVLLRETKLWVPAEVLGLWFRFLKLVQVSPFCLMLFWYLSLSVPLGFNLDVGRGLLGKHFGEYSFSWNSH